MDNVILFQPIHFDTWRAIRLGAMDFARRRGFILQTMKQTPDTEELARTLELWKPRGCIIDCSDATALPSLKVFRNTPHVCLNLPHHAQARHHAFIHDPARMVALAAEEFLTRNYRAYGYVPCEKAYAWSVERGRIFAAKLRQHRKCVKTYRPGSESLDSWLAKLPHPTALFTANDEVAQNVIVAASRIGLNVPDDLSVIGVDNDELYCEGTVPGITSIDTDHFAVGRRLSEILFALIEDPHQPMICETYGPTRLVRRGSTPQLSDPNPRVNLALEFLRRNACRGTIRIEDVAKAMRCSYRLATQEFKQATGVSIISKVHDIRHKRICELLKRTETPISEIIQSVGYDSESFAKRTFRNRTGLSMSDYRRIHRLTG